MGRLVGSKNGHGRAVGAGLAVLMAVAIPGAGAQAPAAGPVEEQPVASYLPAGPGTRALGRLLVGNGWVRFEQAGGTWAIEPAGRLPALLGSDLSGSEVYRLRPRGAAGDVRDLCGGTPRWLTVRALGSGRNASSRDLWVGLLTNERFVDYRPGGDGYCLGGPYARIGPVPLAPPPVG